MTSASWSRAQARTAARRGLGVYGVRPYRLDGSGDSGLIFGYSALDEAAIAAGVAELAEVVEGLRP